MEQGTGGHWKTSTRTQGPFAHPVLSFEIQDGIECSMKHMGRDQRGNVGLPLCWLLSEEPRTCEMSEIFLLATV